MRTRLKVIWSPAVLRDLARRAEWSQRQAQRAYDEINEMAAQGWTLGRRSTLYPGYRYRTVPPLGVLYEVEGGALRVARVLHMAQQLELP